MGLATTKPLNFKKPFQLRTGVVSTTKSAPKPNLVNPQPNLNARHTPLRRDATHKGQGTRRYNRASIAEAPKAASKENRENSEQAADKDTILAARRNNQLPHDWEPRIKWKHRRTAY